MTYLYSPFIIAVFLFPFGDSSAPEDNWFLKAANVPRNVSVDKNVAPVVIAVVDDGIRVSHRSLSAFIYRNANEVPLNSLDDDGNGYTDDVSGWDVSDGDSDASPPRDRLAEFYHGTHLSGVITSILTHSLGEHASRYIKLMPVKALSDYDEKTYLQSGFAGIEYAVNSGADIVLCAWSVSQITPVQAKILNKAKRKGVLIVGAAGNFPENREMFPGAHSAALAVAGVGRDERKMKDSNYGTFVELCAPGIDISGADSQSEDGMLLKTGTSQASAIVAAAAALIKLKNPRFTPLDIRIALKSTATDLPLQSPLHQGRLGSGVLNVAAALEFVNRVPSTDAHNLMRRPQGYLRYNRSDARPVVWDLGMTGEYEGCWLSLNRFDGRGDPGRLVITPRQAGVVQPKQSKAVQLLELERPLFVQGNAPKIMYFPNGPTKPTSWVVEFRMEPDHLPTKFCSGRSVIESPGEFSDGSGESNYSPETNCFWLIKAPVGKVIKFSFSEFDTEPRTDLLYFFDGEKTNAEVMAIFSGADLPPVLTTWRNEVLVWFVSNSENEAGGWRGTFDFVDP